jgi:hypothetical protein
MTLIETFANEGCCAAEIAEYLCIPLSHIPRHIARHPVPRILGPKDKAHESRIPPAPEGRISVVGR